MNSVQINNGVLSRVAQDPKFSGLVSLSDIRRYQRDQKKPKKCCGKRAEPTPPATIFQRVVAHPAFRRDLQALKQALHADTLIVAVTGFRATL